MERTDKALTKKEQETIKTILAQPDAKDFADTSKVLWVFIMGNPPSKVNVSLVEKFLSRDTNDAVKEAAINGLVLYWGITGKYDSTVRNILLEADSDASQLSRMAAENAAMEGIFNSDNEYLRTTVTDKLNYYLSRVGTGLSDLEEINFVYLCSNIVNNYSKYKLNQPIVVELSFKDSLEVATKINDYYGGKIHKIKY